MYTREACLWNGQGADAADLDATIARLTGQTVPATTSSAPAWKQDAKGWWVETNTTTPDGYKVNAEGVWVQ